MKRSHVFTVFVLMVSTCAMASVTRSLIKEFVCIFLTGGCQDKDDRSSTSKQQLFLQMIQRDKWRCAGYSSQAVQDQDKIRNKEENINLEGTLDES